MINLTSLRNSLNENTKDNLFQLIIYGVAYPFALLFKFLNLTPNTITLFSFILFIISKILLLNNYTLLFIVFWYISHFLDYVDGTLARITGNKTKILLRLDHLSDVVKIQITFYTLSIYYNTLEVWSFFLIFNLFFWIKEIIKQQYDFNLLSHKLNINSPKKPNRIIENLKNILFTFNGHSLFLIGLGIIDSSFLIGILAYFTFTI